MHCITRGRLALLPMVVCLAGTSAAAVTRQTVQIPLRDGRSLGADIYLPAAVGTWPAVIIQTPYNKNRFAATLLDVDGTDPLLASRDYVFVTVDWRGYFASAGTLYSGCPTRGQDGYDVVEWVATQSWSTGNVGTWGASAEGRAQFDTAVEHPPHLKACVPVVAQFGETYELYYPGGVYSRNRNDFVSGYFGGTSATAHPLWDNFWNYLETHTGLPATIDVPMLHVSGWYDHASRLSIEQMLDIQAQGGANARGRQILLVGPWSHSHVGEAQQGELAYPQAEHVASAAALAFFDLHLRGMDNGFDAGSPVRYYRINDDWYGASTWPRSEVAWQDLHLTADHALSVTAPADAEAGLDYTSDPLNPVPTLFGAVLESDYGTQGPGDLQPLEGRSDVLAFTTPVVQTPMTIEGEPRVVLHVQCSEVDTDLAVRLTEVYPGGDSMLLVEGIRRASLRSQFSQRDWLQAGQSYAVEFTLPPIAVTVPVGHRLRLLVAPSNHDRFDVNLQDGSSLSDEADGQAVQASVRLLTNATHASRLSLPLTSTGDYFTEPADGGALPDEGDTGGDPSDDGGSGGSDPSDGGSEVDPLPDTPEEPVPPPPGPADDGGNDEDDGAQEPDPPAEDGGTDGSTDDGPPAVEPPSGGDPTTEGGSDTPANPGGSTTDPTGGETTDDEQADDTPTDGTSEPDSTPDEQVAGYNPGEPETSPVNVGCGQGVAAACEWTVLGLLTSMVGLRRRG